MGAQQSTVAATEKGSRTTARASGLFVSDGMGGYRSLSARDFARFYVEAERMGFDQQRLESVGNLFRVTLYERAPDGSFVASSRVFYQSLGISSLAEKLDHEMMVSNMRKQLFDVLRGTPLAGKCRLVEELSDAVAKWGFESARAAPTADDIGLALANVPDWAGIEESLRARIRNVVISAFESARADRSARAANGGVSGSSRARRARREPIPFVGGWTSGGSIAGGGDAEAADASPRARAKDQMGVVKSLYLQKLASSRADLIARLLDVFRKMPQRQLSDLANDDSMPVGERLRKIGEFLRKNVVQNGQRLCRDLVTAVNNAFGVLVVDPAADANICADQLEELLNALSHDMSADIYLLGIDIVRDVRNLEALVEALKVWRNVVPEKYSATDARAILAPLDEIIGEFERYTGNMRIALNQHFMPTFPGIIAQMADASLPKDRSLAARIDSILRGITSTTSAAIAVQAALEKIGLSVGEYRLIQNKNEFWAKFAELIDGAKLNESDDPDEYFKAATYAAMNLGNREEIARAIKERHTGSGAQRGAHGGAPRIPDPARVAIDRATSHVKRTGIIVNAYGQALQGGIRKIRESVDNLAHAVGKEIPLGTELENFRNLLNQLAGVQMESPKVHLALIGYYKDANANDTRDRVLGVLGAVAAYAETVAGDEAYKSARPYFEASARAIRELIAAIDAARDNMRGIVGSESSRAHDIEGGADLSITTIRDVIIRDSLRLSDSINLLNHNIRVAQLQKNLRAMTTNFGRDVANYDTRVLGPAVAARISKLNRARDYVLKKLGLLNVARPAGNDDTFNVDPAGAAAGAGCANLIARDSPSAPMTEPMKDTEIFVRGYYDALIKFWDAAQAIELYLKYFTNAIIENPDDIAEFSLLIREVEVLTQMYNDTSGDDIARIFESNFTNRADAAANNAVDQDDHATTDGEFARWQNIGAFPFSPLFAGKLKTVLTETRERLSRYLALKNLVSFFTHFGGKIGGKELRNISPRSPAEIYYNLTQFLAVSSYAFGFRNDAVVDWAEATGAISNGAAVGAGHVAVDLSNGRVGLGVGASREILMRLATQDVPSSRAAAGGTAEMYDLETALDLRVENATFAAIIKSLGAKVLVLSGMHDLIHRAREAHTNSASVRMILGAGPRALPKIEEPIVELYVRLPLLALFYKRFFTKGDSFGRLRENEADAQIVLLPDIGGSEFGEFIRMIFRQFPHVDTQFFTDNEMALLIAEINKIHAKLASKFPTDTTRGILAHFVSTMSNMIYIISSRDHEELNRKFGPGAGMNSATYQIGDPLEEIDILGQEGEAADAILRPLPADPIVEASASVPGAPSDPFVVSGEHWKLVRKFRCMIDKVLANPATISLNNSVITAQTKLAQTGDDGERFALVCGLVRGTGGTTVIDNMRKMTFIEIMGTGLGLLSAIYSTIRNLQVTAYAASPQCIYEALKAVVASGGMVIAGVDRVIERISREIGNELRIRHAGDVAGLEDPLIQNILEVTMRKINPGAGGINGITSITRNAVGVPTDNLHGISVDPVAQTLDLDNPVTPPLSKDIVAQCLHYPSAMALLLESIVAAANRTNGFVRAEFTDGKLIVDFGLLAEYVREFLATLTSFVTVMRAHVDPELVKRYTDKLTPGSLYWLQEQFIEKLFEGRVTGGKQVYQCTLSKLTEVIRVAFQDLTSEITMGLDGQRFAQPFFVDYSRCLARIIAHGSEGIRGPQAGTDLFRRAQVFADSFDSLLIRDTKSGEKMVDTRYLHSLAMTGHGEVYDDINNSVLFAFNKLIAMLLRQTYDPAAGRIYRGFVEAFTQGELSDAIQHEDHTFPDILPMYWIESGAAREGRVTTGIDDNPELPLGTRGAVEQFRSFAKYMRGLGGNDTKRIFGFDANGIDPFNETGAGDQYFLLVDGGRDAVHKIIYGLASAWFALASDAFARDANGLPTARAGARGALPNTIARSLFDNDLITQVDTLWTAASQLYFNNDVAGAATRYSGNFADGADRQLLLHSLLTMVRKFFGAKHTELTHRHNANAVNDDATVGNSFAATNAVQHGPDIALIRSLMRLLTGIFPGSDVSGKLIASALQTLAGDAPQWVAVLLNSGTVSGAHMQASFVHAFMNAHRTRTGPADAMLRSEWLDNTGAQKKPVGDNKRFASDSLFDLWVTPSLRLYASLAHTERNRGLGRNFPVVAMALACLKNRSIAGPLWEHYCAIVNLADDYKQPVPIAFGEPLANGVLYGNAIRKIGTAAAGVGAADTVNYNGVAVNIVNAGNVLVIPEVMHFDDAVQFSKFIEAITSSTLTPTTILQTYFSATELSLSNAEIMGALIAQFREKYKEIAKITSGGLRIEPTTLRAILNGGFIFGDDNNPTTRQLNQIVYTFAYLARAQQYNRNNLTRAIAAADPHARDWNSIGSSEVITSPRSYISHTRHEMFNIIGTLSKALCLLPSKSSVSVADLLRTTSVADDRFKNSIGHVADVSNTPNLFGTAQGELESRLHMVAVVNHHEPNLMTQAVVSLYAGIWSAIMNTLVGAAISGNISIGDVAGIGTHVILPFAHTPQNITLAANAWNAAMHIDIAIAAGEGVYDNMTPARDFRDAVCGNKIVLDAKPVAAPNAQIALNTPANHGNARFMGLPNTAPARRVTNFHAQPTADHAKAVLDVMFDDVFNPVYLPRYFRDILSALIDWKHMVADAAINVAAQSNAALGHVQGNNANERFNAAIARIRDKSAATGVLLASMYPLTSNANIRNSLHEFLKFGMSEYGLPLDIGTSNVWFNVAGGRIIPEGFIPATHNFSVSESTAFPTKSESGEHFTTHFYAFMRQQDTQERIRAFQDTQHGVTLRTFDFPNEIGRKDNYLETLRDKIRPYLTAKYDLISHLTTRAYDVPRVNNAANFDSLSLRAIAQMALTQLAAFDAESLGCAMREDGFAALVPSTDPASLAAFKGEGITKFINDAEFMEKLICDSRNLFCTLGSLTMTYFAQVPRVGFDLVNADSVRDAFLQTTRNMMSNMIAPADPTTDENRSMINTIAADPNVTTLRDSIFDGQIPTRADLKPLTGALLGAIVRHQHPRDMEDALIRRARISPPRETRRLQQMFEAGTDLPGPPVKTETVRFEDRAMVKHLITLKELRAVSYEPRAQYTGTFIVYPGDYQESDADYTAMRKYHATLYHLQNANITPAQFMSKVAFEARVLPDGSHVLFASLAHLVRNITSAVDRHSTPLHMYDTAVDVPAFMREKYRAHGAFFRTAFDALAQKCGFYRSIISNARAECFRRRETTDATIELARNFADIGFAMREDPVPDKLLGILRSVETNATALSGACARVISDIGDNQPRYFETSLGSIDTYRAQNGSDPIMPLSALLNVARESGRAANKALAPRYGFGEPEFKLQYATRGMFGRAQSPAAQPASITALDSLVTMFNTYSLGKFKIDSKLAQELTSGIVRGFEFINDVRRVKIFTSARDSAHWLGYTPVAPPPAGAPAGAPALDQNLPIHANILRNPDATLDAMKNTAIRLLTNQRTREDAAQRAFVPTPFGLSSGAFDIINVVENRARDEAVKHVVSGTLPIASDEIDPVVANIIDINIVPFDLHVLARQVPLHFIWNYAFTFDSIAGSMLYDQMNPSRVIDAYFTGCRTDKRTGDAPEVAPRIASARDAAFAMIADPYRALDMHEKEWIMRMLIGATGIPGFERPKFLSDQLAGKILYHNAYFMAQPEVGPPSSAVQGGPLEITGVHPLVAANLNEARAYRDVLLAFGRRLHQKLRLPNLEIESALRSAAAILAIARPALPAGANADTDRGNLSRRIVSATVGDSVAATVAETNANPPNILVDHELSIRYNNCDGANRPRLGVLLTTKYFKDNAGSSLTALAISITQLVTTARDRVNAYITALNQQIVKETAAEGIVRGTGNEAALDAVLNPGPVAPGALVQGQLLTTAVTLAAKTAIGNVAATAATRNIAIQNATLALQAVTDMATRVAAAMRETPDQMHDLLETANGDATVATLNRAPIDGLGGALNAAYGAARTAVNATRTIQFVQTTIQPRFNIGGGAPPAQIEAIYQEWNTFIENEMRVATLLAAPVDRPETSIAPNRVVDALQGTICNITVRFDNTESSLIRYAATTDEYGTVTIPSQQMPTHGKVISQMRMDTLLARNLIHISLVLAIVQMRLTRDLTYTTGERTANSLGALNPSIYKFFGTQAQQTQSAPLQGRAYI